MVRSENRHQCKPWTDAETLRYLYHDRGRSSVQLGQRFGCTPENILAWLDEHGIETRDPTGRDEKPWRDESTLRYLYEERGYSSTTIADGLNCSFQTVLNWLDEHGIEKRGPHP